MQSLLLQEKLKIREEEATVQQQQIQQQQQQLTDKEQQHQQTLAELHSYKQRNGEIDTKLQHEQVQR